MRPGVSHSQMRRVVVVVVAKMGTALSIVVIGALFVEMRQDRQQTTGLEMSKIRGQIMAT